MAMSSHRMAQELTGESQRKGRPVAQRKRRFQNVREKESVHPKITTGKYDMRVLHEIQRVEEAALQELVEMYQVESEDHLPINFDIHELIDVDKGNRRPYLAEMLASCPSAGAAAFIDKYLERIKSLNPHL